MTTSNKLVENKLGLKPIVVIPHWRTRESIDLKRYTFQEEVVSKYDMTTLKKK